MNRVEAAVMRFCIGHYSHTKTSQGLALCDFHDTNMSFCGHGSDNGSGIAVAVWLCL